METTVASPSDGINFGTRHGAGNLGELDGEGTSETTAFFGCSHFCKREALHFCQELSRAHLDVQFP